MEKESKARETLRYLGYTFGVVGGMILAGLLYLVLAPLMDIIMVLAWIGGILFFIVMAIASIYYLFIARKE